MVTKKLRKVAPNYYCEKCDYSTSRKSSFDKHLLSAKHQMVTYGYNIKQENNELFECNCGKIYKHRQGLSRHRKMCTFINEEKRFTECKELEIPDIYVLIPV